MADIERDQNTDAAVTMAVAALRKSLEATIEMAASEDHGVTVRYSRNAVPEMKVEMFIDPGVEKGQVRYQNVDEDVPPEVP